MIDIGGSDGRGIIGADGKRIQHPGVPPGAVPVGALVNTIVDKVLQKVLEDERIKTMAEDIKIIRQRLDEPQTPKKEAEDGEN